MNLNTIGRAQRKGFTFLLSWFCFSDNLSERKASHYAKPMLAFGGRELSFHSVIAAFFNKNLLHLRIRNFTVLKPNLTHI